MIFLSARIFQWSTENAGNPSLGVFFSLKLYLNVYFKLSNKKLLTSIRGLVKKNVMFPVPSNTRINVEHIMKIYN